MDLKEPPFKAWKLTPSGKPVEVEIVEASTFLNFPYFRLKTGRALRATEIHETKAEAIAAGFNDCDRRQKEINKTRRRLEKRIAVLKQAAASLPT